MGKRRGITITIRDHEAEAWREDMAALRRDVADWKGQLMATMQDVQDRLRATIAQAQQDRTVIDGLQSVMDWAVSEIRNLRGLAGNPDQLVGQLDELANTLDGNRTRIAAAVAAGTAAENEAAPPVDVNPQPVPGPVGAAQDAGIRDQRNVAAAEAQQGVAQPQDRAAAEQTRYANPNAPAQGQQAQPGPARSMMGTPQPGSVPQSQQQPNQQPQQGVEGTPLNPPQQITPQQGTGTAAAPQGQPEAQQAAQVAQPPRSDAPPQSGYPPLDGFHDPAEGQGQQGTTQGQEGNQGNG